MKQLTTKLLLAFFLILSSIQIFAQTPTDPPGGAEAPIDSNIIILVIAAIILSFIFVVKKTRKTA